MAFVLDASVAAAWLVSSQAADLRRLAARYTLSAYDATCLALALELHLPVACGDRPLKSALARGGVKLV